MNPTPEFLRTLPYVPRLNEDDIQACADAWEAALLALWFEHYKDVYPEGRIDTIVSSPAFTGSPIFTGISFILLTGK
jgi:hypothetical protein